MTYKLFIDESYCSAHYYVAGVLVSPQELEDLEQRFSRMAQYYQTVNNLSHIPEFHGHSIMTGKDDWRTIRGNFGSASALMQRLTREIAQTNATIFIEGVDVDKLNKRYKYPAPPHEICLRHLLERVNEHLSSIGATCKVIADTVPDEIMLQQRVSYYRDATTPGYRGQQLVQFIGDVEFVDSYDHFGVQSADIVAYLHRRLSENTNASKQSKRACERMYKPLRENIKTARKWCP